MEQENILKKKLIKHSLYNILGFSIIFIVFGLFIFLMVRNITYSGVNKELKDAMNNILEINEKDSMIMIKPEYKEKELEDSWFKNAIIKYQDEVLTKIVSNPDITIILRDENQEILNPEDLGRLYEFKNNIVFNFKQLSKIYNLKIDNQYEYRVLDFVYKENNFGTRYIQLLVNIDSERFLVSNYLKIITCATGIGIMLSIIASFILSKKTLEPLRVNMLRQMEFVQNVAHELRTPLTIVQAKLELMLQEPEEKIIDKSEDITLSLKETKRLTKLIKDLMILSRSDTNTEKINVDSLNIDEYIKEIANPYIEVASLQEKEVKLNLNANATIEVDGAKFYQLLVILLDNALKYTEEKDSIEITTNIKDNKLILEVKDTGIGISDEGLQRMFERFYRADKARSRETGGSGLGLSIANSIVTLHRGTIKANHNTPKGIAFTIKLPTVMKEKDNKKNKIIR